MPTGPGTFVCETSIAHRTLAAATSSRRRMVFPAASALSPSTFTVASSKSRLHQLHNSFLINVQKKYVSVTCSVKFPGMGHFNEPTKLLVFMNYTKEKLWKIFPGSMKHFPWKKAQSVAQHELLVLGKETLKWSLLACFAFSSLSDILYSISRNRELVIPFGLFVGILMTKFFVEISQELLPDHKDGRRQLLGISCFFVLVKVMSTYFSGVNDFLLHAANGGLLQVLFNWKEFSKLDGEKSSSDDASTSTNVDN